MHKYIRLVVYLLNILIHSVILYILPHIHYTYINHLLYIYKNDNLLLHLLGYISHFLFVYFLLYMGILHYLYIDYILMYNNYLVLFVNYNKIDHLQIKNVINHILHMNEYLSMYNYIKYNKQYLEYKLMNSYSYNILIYIFHNKLHLLRLRKYKLSIFNNLVNHIIYH